MRFGDYIRDLRRGLQWTQPEAADKIGIEQSYLSKLESGKSYPSEDVFAAIKTAYQIDMVDLSAKLFAGELDQMREISDVRTAILATQSAQQTRLQQWLIAGIVFLMLGGGSLGLNLLAEDKVVTEYQYSSPGVILPGEGLEAFDAAFQRQSGADRDVQELAQVRDQMIARLDQQFQIIPEYRGGAFVEPTENGVRYWRLVQDHSEVYRSPLHWFLAPGLMLLFGAVGCFFASFRWRIG